MTEITCPNCGRKFNVPDGKDKAFCGYCGTVTEIKASEAADGEAAAPVTGPAPEVKPEPIPGPVSEVKDEPAQEPAPEETKSAAAYEPHDEPAPVSEPVREPKPDYNPFSGYVSASKIIVEPGIKHTQEPVPQIKPEPVQPVQNAYDPSQVNAGLAPQAYAYTQPAYQQPFNINASQIPQQQEPAKKKSKTGIIIAAVVIVLLAAAAAVYYFVLMPIYITSIKIDTADIDDDRKAVVLNVGDTYDIEYTASPEDNRHDDLTWTSSDDKIAKVENGKVTAVNEGECKITVTSEKGVNDQIKFYVVVPVEELVLAKTAVSITAGETSVLSVSYTPENATDKHCTWESSDTSVATVNDGLVTAVAEGECTITVTSVDGPTAECTVTVTKPKPESFIIGTWNGYYEESDSDYRYLDDGDDVLIINSDGTAVNYYGSFTDYLTWEYAKTDEDGDYVFYFYFEDGGKQIAWYFNSGSLEGELQVSSSVNVYYQKSTSDA